MASLSVSCDTAGCSSGQVSSKNCFNLSIIILCTAHRGSLARDYVHRGAAYYRPTSASTPLSHGVHGWFLLESVGENPYKLVYNVTRFAFHHKVPLRRSAFTYCDEESPSRMDVAKLKFGGPYTTKQVEDVKAFWGLVKVLLSVGPAWFIQTAAQSTLPAFAKHSNAYMLATSNTPIHHEKHLEGVARYTLVSNGLLSSLLVMLCLPLYLSCIRPHILYHIPRMLTRIKLAVLLFLLSLISSLLMDVVVHLKNSHDPSARCMFNHYVTFNSTEDLPPPPLHQNVYFFVFHDILSALANMLLEIAVLEFICSQSPYSMKGLLLGSLFSMRNLFQGIALVSIIPFGYWKVPRLSCGSGFYLISAILGLLALVVFSCVAKRYKYRQVNEPANEYRYAEEYYSKMQQHY